VEIPKKFLHDRIVLLLITLMAVLVVVGVSVVLLRFDVSRNPTTIVAYRPNIIRHPIHQRQADRYLQPGGFYADDLSAAVLISSRIYNAKRPPPFPARLDYFFAHFIDDCRQFADIDTIKVCALLKSPSPKTGTGNTGCSKFCRLSDLHHLVAADYLGKLSPKGGRLFHSRLSVAVVHPGYRSGYPQPPGLAGIE
jgi:hypothetical protein